MERLTPDLLLRAYRAGLFPMADSADSDEIYWVEPRRRGILPLQDFHISRSLGRRIRQAPFRISLDRDFGGVMDGCAARPDTWINRTIHSLYRALHSTGDAHSIEIWEGEDLVGGVYGIAVGGCFCGESMFSRRRDASKIALAYLTHHLWRRGFTLFDTQFLTAHLASLGAIEISQQDYLRRLKRAQEKECDFGPKTEIATPQEVLQRNTHTS